MARRLGAVIKFRQGVSKRQAIDALRLIRQVLDVPETVTDLRPAPHKRRPSDVRDPVEFYTRPLRGTDLIKEYEEEHGEPVWYIP